MIPARCERSRQSISLRLDGQLSLFESALLERHLRNCPSCRAFAADVVDETRLLRAAPLELPEHRLELALPVRRQPIRAVAVTLAGAVAAAAAALVLVAPGGAPSESASRLTGPHQRVLVDVATQWQTGVPQTTSVSTAGSGDEVRGVFSLPV
jgi:predicted anti-sigma-YlaC factor YlaD